MVETGLCPCGSGMGYGKCCGRLHRGEAQAATALELMRSRYAAFAIGDGDYLWRTWHPRTRPKAVILDPARQWLGLQIEQVVDGQAGDETGVVEFIARYRQDGSRGEQRERSNFERRARRWFYVDGS